MYNKGAVVKGPELLVNINLGRLNYNTPKNTRKNKPGLTFAEEAKIQEIPHFKNIVTYNSNKNVK